jgi:hypothetical protein
MIAVLLMTVTMVIVALVHRSGAEAFQKARVHGDVYRMAMLAVEQMRRELHGAKVTDVTATQVKYLVPLVENGHVKVCEDGRIEFEPLEARIFLFKDGSKFYLVRSFNGEVRQLSCLGEEGSVSFSLPDPRLLVAEITAKRPGDGSKTRESEYALKVNFSLPNQNN